ncbi:CehA/McbA family metallohydrolase [soil metagenome]
MHNLPFDKPGRFWRGNLHTHSTRSDGALAVPEVVAAYRGQGYDFLAVTDHFMERFGYPIVDTREYRTGSFTTMLGAELHAPALSHGERWHLLAVGLPLEFTIPREDENGPQIARRAVEAGAFLAIAHPNWYSLTLADALTIDSAHAVEVYNHTANHHNDRGDSWATADQLLMSGRRLHAVATDDAHFSTRPDYFGGWVQVRSHSLEPDLLLAALKQGHFYSSQGPEIREISITGEELVVTSSPARAVFLTGPGSLSRHLRGDRLMGAAFPLEPFANSFCRVTVVDDWGRKAWSNPIWLDGSV